MNSVTAMMMSRYRLENPDGPCRLAKAGGASDLSVGLLLAVAVAPVAVM